MRCCNQFSTAGWCSAAVRAVAERGSGTRSSGLCTGVRARGRIPSLPRAQAGVSVPINEPSNVHGHGYVDIGFVVPEAVQTVVATKGSTQLSQGDFATAGSIELELGVDSSRRGQRMAYQVGSTNRHRALALVAPKNLPEASFLAIEGMSDAGFGTNRASERMTLLGQHRVELSSDRYFQFLGAGYAARFDEPGTVPLADVQGGELGFYDTYNDVGDGNSARGLISARFHDESTKHTMDAGLYSQWRTLRLAENFTGNLAYPEMGDLKEQTHVARTVGARSRYESRLGARFQLAVLADARADQIEQTEDQLTPNGMPWQRNRDLSGTLVGGGLGAALRFGLGAFRAEASTRLDLLWMQGGEQLVMSSGPRSETLVQGSPRLSLGYRLAPGWNLFGGYGHGLRSPEARSLGVPADEQAVHFTTSRSTELGLEGRMDQGLSFGVTGFGTWIDNELVFDHFTGANLARNATRRLGVEAHAEVMHSSSCVAKTPRFTSLARLERGVGLICPPS